MNLNFIKDKVEKHHLSSTFPNTIIQKISPTWNVLNNHYCNTTLKDKLNHILGMGLLSKRFQMKVLNCPFESIDLIYYYIGFLGRNIHVVVGYWILVGLHICIHHNPQHACRHIVGFWSSNLCPCTIHN